jgi:D-alanyl-D-alanine carboxypeptidase
VGIQQLWFPDPCAVIDRVSGQDYFDYVRDHIYTPAGMTSTGSEPEDQSVPDRGIGYITARRLASGHGRAALSGMSAGGGYTTVGDLLRFANTTRQQIARRS